jgi:hypothetical protein
MIVPAAGGRTIVPSAGGRTGGGGGGGGRTIVPNAGGRMIVEVASMPASGGGRIVGALALVFGEPGAVSASRPATTPASASVSESFCRGERRRPLPAHPRIAPPSPSARARPLALVED